MQFGFKQKSSAVQCSFVVEEVINYYCITEGNVCTGTTFWMHRRFSTVLRSDTLFELLVAKHLPGYVQSRSLEQFLDHLV